MQSGYGKLSQVPKRLAPLSLASVTSLLPSIFLDPSIDKDGRPC